MVNKSRSRGRPRKFDEAAALSKATAVFWAKGFEGTTIDDLVAAMGVVRPSLYTVFGDKEKLFVRCLEHYIQKVSRVTVDAMLAAQDVRSAIRGFLRQSVLNATAEGSPRGCMMGIIAPVVGISAIQEFTVRSMTAPPKIVEQRLQEAVAAGELPGDFPCALRARQIFDLANGMSLRARLGEEREVLLKDAEDAVELFFDRIS